MKNTGVRLRFLTTINRDNIEAAEELAKHFEVRHLDRVPQRAILGDEEIGFSWIPVKEGDVICFSSILPHVVRNPGKEKVVYFSVVIPPTFM